ncbi:MAG: transporter substrate-binding domain-containing protein [Holosporaceae bacterium]|jgi:polar amino acid transport system substrate-binding protein|nr:transporter substrate-binding domain-containing protein [Holosporaceae bacterium]
MGKYMRYMRTLAAIVLLLTGCGEDEKKSGIAVDCLKFATCADCPPFEYYESGNITGLDIELARALAKKLGKTAIFKDMQFGAILVSVQNEIVDAAISAIEVTEERKKRCDFSDVYCKSKSALVYKKGSVGTKLEQISKSKVAYQCGASGHLKLLQDKAPAAELVAVDNVNVAIESLKAGHVKYILIDSVPARMFCEKNSDLEYSVVAENDGYVIMLKKGSALRAKINTALEELNAKGELERLRTKYQQ